MNAVSECESSFKFIIFGEQSRRTEKMPTLFKASYAESDCELSTVYCGPQSLSCEMQEM